MGHLVVVVGAGPAGIAATEALVEGGCRVALINRDLKYGGLAEYGIYPDKVKLKEGLKRSYRKTLSHPAVSYFGNVKVGRTGAITLPELRSLAHAVVLTAGAQGSRTPGLEGEDARGVYPAKDLVYHYNRLPLYTGRAFHLGRRMIIIGMGDVMVDIAHYLLGERGAEEVTVLARRGPAERKWGRREVEDIAPWVDGAALDREMERIAPRLLAAGQDAPALRSEVMTELNGHGSPHSSAAGRLRFRFLTRPARILTGAGGGVRALEVEDTRLYNSSGELVAIPLGTRELLDCDGIIYAMGERVDPDLGLPVRGDGFATDPDPAAGNGGAYRAYDPVRGRPIEGLFLAGWCRRPSEGRVGPAKKDGQRAAECALDYIARTGVAATAAAGEERLPEIERRLRSRVPSLVTWAEVKAIEEAEKAQAQRLGLTAFRYPSQEEMLAAIRLNAVG